MEVVNKYDSYTWVLRVIRSCKTSGQTIKSRKLIRNFFNLYKDEYLYRCLRYYTDIKEEQLNVKQVVPVDENNKN